jgi:hypothetical protein
MLDQLISYSEKEGADRGIDDQLYFHDEEDSKKGKTKQIMLSVKSVEFGKFQRYNFSEAMREDNKGNKKNRTQETEESKIKATEGEK